MRKSYEDQNFRRPWPENKHRVICNLFYLLYLKKFSDVSWCKKLSLSFQLAMQEQIIQRRRRGIPSRLTLILMEDSQFLTEQSWGGMRRRGLRDDRTSTLPEPLGASRPLATGRGSSPLGLLHQPPSARRLWENEEIVERLIPDSLSCLLYRLGLQSAEYCIGPLWESKARFLPG